MKSRKYGNLIRWRVWGIFLVMLMTGLTLIVAAFLRSEVQNRHFEVHKVTEEYGTPEGEFRSEPVPSSPDVSLEAGVPEEVSSDDRPPVALLVDDFGHNAQLAGRIAELDFPLTWAILPYLRYSGEMARLAEEKGVPFFLHLPLQAEIDDEDGPFLIGTSMERGQIHDTVQRAIESLPGLSGVNNHRGSKATSDARTMAAVLDVIDKEGLLFVDSRTSSSSLAYKLAKNRGIPAAYNCIFLDNEADIQSMKVKLAMIASRARNEGWALAICHVRPRTVEFLEELERERPEDIRFVTVPELISVLGPR